MVESVNPDALEPAAIHASYVDRSAYRRVNLAMALFLALIALSLVFDNRLPAPDKLVARIADEPLQTETDAEPFTRTVNNMTYQVVPVANYDLSGLVVSFHDSKTWWDYIHEAAHDYVNVDDLCVVWGADAVTGIYREVSFSNSEFSCEWESSRPTSSPFQPDGFSNNHMLTDKPYIARALRSLRVGDQIRFSGYLVNYSNVTMSPDFSRNSSTTRDDTGPGACEVVWVTDLQVLHAATRLWLYLRWLSVIGLIVTAVIWLALPYRGRPA
jgi:hypothetical protein